MKTSRLKNKLSLFLMLIVAAGILIVATVTVFSELIAGKISLIFETTSHLTDFYNNISHIQDNENEMLFGDSQLALAYYEELFALAEANADFCCHNTTGDTAMRLKNLTNMVTYVKTPYLEYVEGNISKSAMTGEIRARCLIVEDAASKYYTLLSDYTNTKSAEIQGYLNISIIICVLVLIAAIVAFFIFIRKLSVSITTPIKELISSAKEIQNGEFEIKRIDTDIEEFMDLDSAINYMAKQIESNISTIIEKSNLEKLLMEEKNRSLEMQSLVAEANLKKLQSQINPHFLFNTLNTISNIAYLNNDEESKELMDKLMRFLRYALDKTDSTSTLEEELSSIEDYIFIQNVRFGERIQYDISIKGNVPNIEMPAVILQPLIENAQIHGVDKMESGGIISVKIRYFEPYLKITVEDNGIGMSPETLEKVQISLFSDEQPVSDNGRKSIGLRNIYRRLLAFYGSQLEFSIESQLNCGTLITIMLNRGEL